MTDPAKDLDLFDLMEEWKGQDTSEDVEYMRNLLQELRAGKDPLATALLREAHWQARAERLEELVDLLFGLPAAHLPDACMCETCNRVRELSTEALSSPRPEPSRILEVVRAALRWLDEAEQDAAGLGEAMSEYVVSQFSGAECELLVAVDTLTLEEKAAILGEEATESSE